VDETGHPSAGSVRVDPRSIEMTVIQKRADNPVAHLTAEDIERLGAALDALREEVVADLGEADARYIRRVITAQRWLELGSRGVLLFAWFPPAWVVGTVGLSAAKIIENMEMGHNILHGQWDWMRDPAIHSTTWEWDNVAPAEMWKHSHNEIHHRYTNVVGRDNDLGYGIMRVDEDQRWHPMHLGQPLWNFVNACFFEYGIAAYDLELGTYYKRRRKVDATFKRNARKVLGKIGRQVRKDYLAHPLLAALVNPFNAVPAALATLSANVVANLARNLWTHSVIMCGHFPSGVATFAKTSIEGETRGEWYLRQMVGSANISGGRLTHLMTGNLSFQVEHHLFPDLPSIRYARIAPRVRALFDEHGLTYVSGPLPRQVASAWAKVIRLSLPNDLLGRVNRTPAPAAPSEGPTVEGARAEGDPVVGARAEGGSDVDLREEAPEPVRVA
jgi:NADPH-dependent stearoyl-CoA 9-desaturase